MTGPDRGRLVPPPLDDRTWQQLKADALALVPSYAPQWTDLGPSDLGVTLVELFAYLVEGLTYRLNRVPEKNYVAFLSLLGITRDPATPAQAFLSFTAASGAPVLVPLGTQAQTAATETEPPVVFETDEDVLVVPTSLTATLRVPGASYANVSARLVRPPATGVDFVVPAGGNVLLGLGFDRQTAQEIRLRVRLSRPALPTAPVTLTWTYSTGTSTPAAWTALPGVTDGTAGLSRDGEIRFTVPAGWAGQAPPTWGGVIPATAADQISTPLFWVGLRLANAGTSPVTVGLAALLHNSAQATNALTIPAPEPLGTGTDRPYQTLELAHRPLYRGPDTDTPYADLAVTVGGAPWGQVVDVPHGPGAVYRVDPVVGAVRFGDFDPAAAAGHGTIPPAGAPIVAQSYRYVAGGADGNVGAGTVVALRTPVTGIVAVTNLASAQGGSNEEDIEVAKHRAPEMLRNRDRAVTTEDYAYLAREATTDVALVACLEPRLQDAPSPLVPPAWQQYDPWTFGGIDRAPGVVNVIVVPDLGPTAPRPEPSDELIREVQRHLDRRRPVASRVVVLGPRYVPVRATVEISLFRRAIDNGLVAGAPAVTAATLAAVEEFLHPVHGRGGSGWQVGEAVFIADLFRAVAPDEAVGFVSNLAVEPLTPLYHAPPIGPGGAWNDTAERPFTLALGTPRTAVRLVDYELVCSATGAGGAHNVTTIVVT